MTQEIDLDLDTFFPTPKEQEEKREYKKTPYFNFNKEVNKLIVRIAPMCRKLATKSGKHNYVYRSTHWGYTRTLESGKEIPAPFRCIFQKENQYFKGQSCPLCLQVKEVEGKIAKRKKELMDSGTDYETIQSILRDDEDFVYRFQAKAGYLYYAKNQENVWGFLKLKSRAQGALKILREKVMQDEGYDIFNAVKGAWVVLERSKPKGSKSPTEINFTATLLQEKSADGSKRDKTDSLTKADIMAIHEMPELYDQGGAVLTEEEIQEIVDAHGDPAVVASIFNKPRELSPDSSTTAKDAAQALETVQMAKTDKKPQIFKTMAVKTPAELESLDSDDMSQKELESIFEGE